MKRMMHPQHGFQHVYSGNEEAAMRANGWVEEAEAAPDDDHIDALKKPIEATFASEPAPAPAAPVEPARRKRGPNKKK